MMRSVDPSAVARATRPAFQGSKRAIVSLSQRSFNAFRDAYEL